MKRPWPWVLAVAAAVPTRATAFKGWMRIDLGKSLTTGAPVRVDVWFHPQR